jgi:hypothetical protein
MFDFKAGLGFVKEQAKSIGQGLVNNAVSNVLGKFGLNGSAGITAATDPNAAPQAIGKDTMRARLGPSPRALKQLLGSPACGNILRPLWETNGILFPYTPTITFGAIANYNNFHFTHSNYQYHNFQNSAPSEISLTATFTAQTNDEGRYMLAVLTFLRYATMMEFGVQRPDVAGTPPPVLKFNYLGGHMFNNVPVIVNNFSYTLEDGVDYVPVRLGDGVDTSVPTKITMLITLLVQQSPRNVRENFNLDEFKQGRLIDKGFI